MNTPTPDTLFDYYALVKAAFDHAGQAAKEIVEQQFCIAGFVIHIRSIGQTLHASLTKALQHLAVAEQGSPPSISADLTITLWDGHHVNTPPPSPLSWAKTDLPDLPISLLNQRGEFPQFNSNAIKTSLHQSPRRLSLLNLAANNAFYWVQNAEHLPAYERGFPLQQIFGWWFSRRGRVLVHAGAVANPHSGVLFVGESGAGKSSTALACLSQSFNYISDDRCFVSTNPPTIHSVYNTAQLKMEDSLHRYPLIASIPHGKRYRNQSKHQFFLHETMPAKLSSQGALRAILIPQIQSQRQTTLRATTPQDARLALVPSSIHLMPSTARSALPILNRLVQRVPCYRLLLGSDPHGIVDTVTQLLEPYVT